MAAFSGGKTLAELASEYGVHPTMSSTWKQELVKNAEELFELRTGGAGRADELLDRIDTKGGQAALDAIVDRKSDDHVIS